MTMRSQVCVSARWSHVALSVIVIILSFSTIFGDASSSSTAPALVTVGTSGGNPAVQLVGYLKESVVRTVDGVHLMWKNYGRCNEIRAKQKEHRELLRVQYENDGMSTQDIKQQLKTQNGGITYEEYAFLMKGKEDRGKLTQLAFLSWGAPRFLPYALMFYPEMLPSAFSSPKVTSVDKMEALSRHRTHTVIQTLMNIENSAKQIPTLAKLNIFGRKKQQQTMENMQRIRQLAASLFVTPVKSGSQGAELVLKTLEDDLYNEIDFDNKRKRLTGVPKPIITGLASSLDGNSPLESLFPLFVTRGKLLNQIRKVTESDEFLVNEAVNLEELGKSRLVDACTDRLIGSIGRSEEEMRENLADWLDHVAVKPANRIRETGEFFNGGLARAAMMCYSAAQAAKDERATSCLPRLLFQGQAEVPKDGTKKARQQAN